MLDTSWILFFKAQQLWILELNQNKEYIFTLQAKSDNNCSFHNVTLEKFYVKSQH